MVKTIIKTAGDALGKGFDTFGKIRCGEHATVKGIFQSRGMYDSVFASSQTVDADIDLTKEYKRSDILDEIRRARLSKIMNGERLTDEQLNELEELEYRIKCAKEFDEYRASEECHKKRIDNRVTAALLIGMTTIVPPVLKKILKKF